MRILPCRFFPQSSHLPPLHRPADQRKPTAVPAGQTVFLYHSLSETSDYNGAVPYVIGRVQLPEGVFILSQINAAAEDLHVGMGTWNY